MFLGLKATELGLEVFVPYGGLGASGRGVRGLWEGSGGWSWGVAGGLGEVLGASGKLLEGFGAVLGGLGVILG